MKKPITDFLKVVLVFVGLGALVWLIRFPLLEGRAAHLDLLSIYTDPFILYGYAASLAFFVGLYQTFQLLGYLGREEWCTTKSLQALTRIKHSAIAFGVLVVLAGMYILRFHAKEDDPVGFVVICGVVALICTGFAGAASRLARNIAHNLELGS